MTKKKDENVTAVETEDLKAKFQEKLKELLEMGKKKRNILEYQEISDFFKDMNLDAEKMERVLDYLEHNGIDVLKMMDDLDDDDEIILDEEDDIKEITFLGVCTDICVISNAMLAKATLPEATIKVVADCCAGVTPDRHNVALEAMDYCQIEIV